MTPCTRRSLPKQAWPGIDCQLWQNGKKGADGARLQSNTLAMIAAGYGRWLSALASAGRLDAALPPAERVTPKAVLRWVDTLREEGSNHRTIIGRLGQLAAALRLMHPEQSFTWLHPSRLFCAAWPRMQGAEHRDHDVSEWPRVDQRLWRAGLQGGDVLSGPRYGAGLRPETLRTVFLGYRHWLRFLQARGRLDPALDPALRLTREAVIDYFRHLRETRCNASVIGQLSILRSAMRIMQPEADFRWLTSPGGQWLGSILPVCTRPIQVPDSGVLYLWGQKLMREALVQANPERRRIDYRDGLLIALFAARAPRVRSMASLRLGSTVIQNGDVCRLVFQREHVKTRRLVEYHAPAGLAAAIRRYVEVERAELAARQSHGWFWVDQYGDLVSTRNLGNIVRRRSKAEFGAAFGPHRFRHALGTSAPLRDPAHPGVAAAVLGISSRMVERHYNVARQMDVAKPFHNSLRKERARLESLARREFGGTSRPGG